MAQPAQQPIQVQQQPIQVQQQQPYQVLQQPVQVQYVAPIAPPQQQNDILNYPLNYINGVLSWGIEFNEHTTTLEWKRGLIRKTHVIKTHNIQAVTVQNVRFVSLFYLLTSFRLKPAYLWGAFILTSFIEWFASWVTFSTTQSADGIKVSAAMGIICFIITITAPIFFKLSGMRRVTNPVHMLLFTFTGILSFAQFICACGFLYYNNHATNPGYYFSFLTCAPFGYPNPVGDTNICHLQLYGWAVAMTVLSFLCFVLCCITARVTYFLWGSAFLAHPGRDPICRVTFLSKKHGYNAGNYNGMPEYVILREQDAHTLRRMFTSYVSSSRGNDGIKFK